MSEQYTHWGASSVSHCHDREEGYTYSIWHMERPVEVGSLVAIGDWMDERPPTIVRVIDITSKHGNKHYHFAVVPDSLLTKEGVKTDG